MADYTDIYGKRVKNFDSDPTLDSSYEGQVWYNSTSGTLKSVVTSFAFRSGTSLPSGRDYGVGGGATQNASWIAGGEEGSTQINTTFEYNGSGWAASGNMSDARIRLPLGNNGPQTAGLGAGGYSPGIVSGVEEYDGSTWTGGTAMPGALQQAGGAGPQTANIVLGGGNPTTAISYNGSAWASEGSSSEAFAYYGLAGENSEACLAFYGAEGPPGTNRTTGEEYNGTAWTTVVGTLPNQGNSGGAQGTTTAAIFAGNSTTVRSYDGTSITLEPAMTQPRGNGYIGGTATSGITSGGSAPGSTANCEEFDTSINTITAAAWAAGGTLNTARGALGGGGTQTAAIGFGGTEPGSTGKTETYDGSTFTEVADLNTARGYLGGCGTQTAALGCGGYTSAPNTQGQAITEEWDGSSWSESGDLSTSRYGNAMAGTQTAGLTFGGYKNPPSSPVVTNTTEEYNGSSWTSGGALGLARYMLAGAGLQTAAIAALGYKYGSPLRTTQTEEYNGSSWTTGGAAITERSNVVGGGTQDAFLVFGGTLPPGPALSSATEGYDGTSWSTRPSLATARRRMGAAANGTQTAGLGFGGQEPSASNKTEEFTGETTTVTAKTLTTS